MRSAHLFSAAASHGGNGGAHHRRLRRQWWQRLGVMAARRQLGENGSESGISSGASARHRGAAHQLVAASQLIAWRISKHHRGGIGAPRLARQLAKTLGLNARQRPQCSINASRQRQRIAAACVIGGASRSSRSASSALGAHRGSAARLASSAARRRSKISNQLNNRHRRCQLYGGWRRRSLALIIGGGVCQRIIAALISVGGGARMARNRSSLSGSA